MKLLMKVYSFGLVNLVVQDVGKQGDVQLAALILEAHHAVVVLVELLGQLIIRQADAALQRGLAGRSAPER